MYSDMVTNAKYATGQDGQGRGGVCGESIMDILVSRFDLLSTSSKMRIF